jgi:hypothetical protein
MRASTRYHLTEIPMPEDDLTLQMPGDEGTTAAPAAPASRRAAAAAPAPITTAAPAGDDVAARIAQLEQDLAQAHALNEQLLDAQGADTAAAPPAAKEPKLIGENWSNMTAAQAKAAGVAERVLCSDGYYCP